VDSPSICTARSEDGSPRDVTHASFTGNWDGEYIKRMSRQEVKLVLPLLTLRSTFIYTHEKKSMWRADTQQAGNYL